MSLIRSKFRRFLRLAAHWQLMPALESGDDPLIGGQAVIEGVMMRSPHSYCIAVRRPDGAVVIDESPITRLADRYRILRWPVLRGVATLGQALTLGMRALRFSANQSLAAENESRPGKQPVEISGWLMALNIAVSLGIFVFLYKFLPLAAASRLEAAFPSMSGPAAFSLVDGVIRLGIFLAFLGLISRLPDIRRVFQYHGAEHKVVFNFESGRPVDVANAQSFSTFHPRCGTSFLMVVMLVSIGVYALLPFESFGPRLLSRVALLPLIAGLSYEVIRFAARRGEGLVQWLVAPGLWLQRITTQAPDGDQVEVSIRALRGAMRLEEAQQGRPVAA